MAEIGAGVLIDQCLKGRVLGERPGGCNGGGHQSSSALRKAAQHGAAAVVIVVRRLRHKDIVPERPKTQIRGRICSSKKPKRPLGTSPDASPHKAR